MRLRDGCVRSILSASRHAAGVPLAAGRLGGGLYGRTLLRREIQVRNRQCGRQVRGNRPGLYRTGAHRVEWRVAAGSPCMCGYHVPLVRCSYLSKRDGRLEGSSLEFGVTLLRVNEAVTASAAGRGSVLCAMRQLCGLMRARASVAALRLPCYPRSVRAPRSWSRTA